MFTEEFQECPKEDPKGDPKTSRKTPTTSRKSFDSIRKQFQALLVKFPRSREKKSEWFQNGFQAVPVRVFYTSGKNSVRFRKQFREFQGRTPSFMNFGE